MRYSGSKRRIARHIIPIITRELDADTTFVDAFGGGMNVISEVDHDRKMAVELNRYVCALWKHIREQTLKGKGTETYLPKRMTRETYEDIRRDYAEGTGRYPMHITGYTATALSYGGAWFNGYARFNPNKNEDHILEAFNGITRQVENFRNLKDTVFVNASYDDVELPEKAVIYCDPPYANTKGYENGAFDHDRFWQWCRDTAKKGYRVYVSEYEAPEDFTCVWQGQRKDGMGTTKKGGRQKTKTEKLFTI